MKCGTCKKSVHYATGGGRGVRYHANGKRDCRCTRCGKSKSDVRAQLNLYALEINEERVFEIICDDCRQELADDI